MATDKKKLRDMIEERLENVEKARNSDVTLTIEVWKKYYPEYVLDTSQGEKSGIFLDALFILPREDNIKRIRATIQNEEKKFLPTDPEVRRKRKISEEEWYDYLGYARRDPNQTAFDGITNRKEWQNPLDNLTVKKEEPKAVSWLNDED